MFQTEPILLLQRFAVDGVAGEVVTGFFLLVSACGRNEAYAVLFVVMASAIDLRRALVLVHVALWIGLLTDQLEAFFDLPEPHAVDGRVLLPDGGFNAAPFDGSGAESFWGPLPDDVLAYYRSRGDFARGFPCGRCATAAAVWGSLPLLFGRRWLVAPALAFVVATGLSRMFLGRQFLAGVVAGTLLGVLGLALVVATAPWWRPRLATLRRLRGELHPGLVLYLMASPTFLALVVGGEAGWVAGLGLLGLNGGLFVILARGLPVYRRGLTPALFRLALALAAILVLLFVWAALGRSGLLEAGWMRGAVLGLLLGLSIWVPVEGGVVLGLSNRSARSRSQVARSAR